MTTSISVVTDEESPMEVRVQAGQGGDGENNEEWKKMLIPGLKFLPTDQDLIQYYLFRKINGDAILYGIIADLNINDYEPFQLSSYAFDFGNGQLYFFTPRYRKHANGHRPNRFTKRGFWRATGKAISITGANGVEIGSKTCLVYHMGHPSADKSFAPKKTTWLMHEFKISENIMPPNAVINKGEKLDEWVLCRIYFKESKKNEQAATTTNDNNDGALDVSSPYLIEPVSEHQHRQLPSPSGSLEPGQPLFTIEPVLENQPEQFPCRTSGFLDPAQPLSTLEPVSGHQHQQFSTSGFPEPAQPLFTLEPVFEHQPTEQFPCSTSSFLELSRSLSTLKPVWEHQLPQFPISSVYLEPGQPLIYCPLVPVWEDQFLPIPSFSDTVEPGFVDLFKLPRTWEEGEQILYDWLSKENAKVDC